jgi:hypothetical protein
LITKFGNLLEGWRIGGLIVALCSPPVLHSSQVITDFEGQNSLGYKPSKVRLSLPVLMWLAVLARVPGWVAAVVAAVLVLVLAARVLVPV